jgi:hypothetical protein
MQRVLTVARLSPEKEFCTMRICQVRMCCCALALLALSSAKLHADLFSTLAVDNATVWPDGPRPGPNGKIFFNAEGPSNGDFAGYGVAHFDSTLLGIDFTVDRIDSVTVTLVQANAAFTHDGTIHFSLTTDVNTDIQPGGTSPLVYDPSDNPDGLASQLQPRFALGGGTFTQGDNGTVDSYTFGLDADAEAYLVAQINAGGKVRIIVSPADADVSATYAGFAHDEFAGPQLTVDAFPAN